MTLHTVPRNTLRVRRAEKEVAQYDVSVAIGMSRDRYWRIEKGYAVPTDEEREALAAYFGVAVDTLFPTPVALEQAS
jgi:transcriptional regulator with XRE-family HTH domain